MSMSATSRFFALPELRLYLSEHVESQSDLSTLSRIDRLSQLHVSPVLYATIDAHLKDITLIADALRTRPELACRTVSFTLRSFEHEYVRCKHADRKELFRNECHELAFVLYVLSKHGRLETFEWSWEPDWPDNCEVPQSVWEALSLNALSLRHVDIALSQADHKSWNTFTSNPYSRLRSLRMDLSKANAWNNARFQDMLMNAQDLVSLQLKLPTSRGPQDLALSSVHGRLRSLSFHGSALTGEPITGQASTKDFLKRHPEIKYLDLCTQTTLELDDEDLPNLCVVSVDHTTLDAVPRLFSPTVQRPVKALRLTRMPHLTTNTVFTLTSAVARTLKFLHMDSSIFSFRANISRFADLLHTLPELVELRLGAESSCAFQLQHKLCEQDLVQCLTTLTDESAPSLQAISFVDSRGKQLTQLCINKLPPTPPSLKHIAWDVAGTRYLYEIVEKSHSASRAVLVNESPSKAPRLWIQESIMDHFGTEVDGW